MHKLPNPIYINSSEDLAKTLKDELESYSPDELNLIKYATVSGYFTPEITVMILHLEQTAQRIDARIAVLYTEIEPAYCCPMIPNEHPGMGEMKLVINKHTGEAYLDVLV